MLFKYQIIIEIGPRNNPRVYHTHDLSLARFGAYKVKVRKDSGTNRDGGGMENQSTSRGKLYQKTEAKPQKQGNVGGKIIARGFPIPEKIYLGGNKNWFIFQQRE